VESIGGDSKVSPEVIAATPQKVKKVRKWKKSYIDLYK
jgi:hypothetical protein